MCGMCIEAATLECIKGGRIQIDLAKTTYGETSDAYLEPHCLAEVAIGSENHISLLLEEHPKSPSIIWAVLNANQKRAFSEIEYEIALDVLTISVLEEPPVIEKSLNKTLPHLLSFLKCFPLQAACDLDGLFENIKARDDLHLVISDAEILISYLCGNYISRYSEFKFDIFTQEVNGVTDDQVNDIFNLCPVSIFLAKWLLERLKPNHIAHELIPIFEAPVPYFTSYYMAWRRHATLWLYQNKSESEFLYLLPVMYVEALFHLKQVTPISERLSNEIDKRVKHEGLGC
ncbi:hypothetical protein AVL57_00270 (plasmid) [Alteromonas stellipolaris]|uniref:Uncharacterized protein n=2 Tax=Alteromonas stellipolaris TaxID=233316 RepID=A0ABM5YPX3_9ALTE|nr:hypothetical protein AVL57_00270 [Alteromonas stellipolaris]